LTIVSQRIDEEQLVMTYLQIHVYFNMDILLNSIQL